jgi:hypothetical protein
VALYTDNLKSQFLGFYQSTYLFDKSINNINPFSFDKIDIENIDFTKLIINEKIPLGKRVERFFQFYIENSPRYELINQNIQIIEDKNTIGEIDFILKDKIDNKYKHIELVYKFYLYDDSFNTELEKYIGPNRDDSLIKKLTKLENKQFPLLYHPIVKNYLKDMNIKETEQELCLFANIFLPKKIYNTKLPLVNNSTIKGFYINCKEFYQNEYKNFYYHLPHRYDWINNPNSTDEYLRYDDVLKEIEYFMSIKKSVLVWMKENKSEYKRFFITWW